MALDCPLAVDLVPILRADRNQVERELPQWTWRLDYWLSDLRGYDADNDEMRAAIAARKEDQHAR